MTLSGNVGGAAEKRRATNIAWTAGTRDVNAQALQVDPSVLEQDRKKVLTEISDPLIAQDRGDCDRVGATHESIEAVAQRVGHDDVTFFFRGLFKRRTGVTPALYRQRIRAILA